MQEAETAADMVAGWPRRSCLGIRCATMRRSGRKSGRAAEHQVLDFGRASLASPPDPVRSVPQTAARAEHGNCPDTFLSLPGMLTMSDPPRQESNRALLRNGFLVADKYGLVEPLGS